jgi:transposase
MPRRFWVGLDVGVETTSICVIDDAGGVLQATTCPTKLEAIHHEIRWLRRRRFARVGLESSTGMSIARGLRSRGYSVDLYETRQLGKFLSVRRNKTDAGDAAGIADAGRIGATAVSKVHLKSLECQSLQSRLAIRRHLIRQRVAAVNLLCRQIEHYGGRVTGNKKNMQFFAGVEMEITRVFGKVSNPLTSELRHLLRYCEQLIECERARNRDLARLAKENEICGRFMEIPGVGPICALTFYAAIDQPHRFGRSSEIGSYFGLTPRLHQSGLSARMGRISRMGNVAVRTALTHASAMFISKADPDCQLRNWATRLQERRGNGRARVALARKLAVIMLAMWKTGQRFSFKPGCAA